MKMDTKQDFRHPPPQGFLKFNIDGASKGNRTTVGFGGILRDENGSTVFIFHWHLRRSTNNMAELMATKQCLDFMKHDSHQNVIVEAHSELVINSVKRISCGIALAKVSKHLRMIQVFQWIQIHLQSLCIVTFNHVRRLANKLADILANQGVIHTKCNVEMEWKEMPQDRLKAYFHDQANEYWKVFQIRAMEARSR